MTVRLSPRLRFEREESRLASPPPSKAQNPRLPGEPRPMAAALPAANHQGVIVKPAHPSPSRSSLLNNAAEDLDAAIKPISTDRSRPPPLALSSSTSTNRLLPWD